MNPFWRERMMRTSCLLCVLLGSLAWGQAAPGTPAPSQPAQAPAEQEAKPQAPAPAPPTPTAPAAPEDKSGSVPANAPVLTIDGVCPLQPQKIQPPPPRHGRGARHHPP